MTTQAFAVMVTAWALIRSPAALAVFSMGLGFSLLLWGVFTLLGLGATLLVGSIPPLLFGLAVLRGVSHAE